MSTMNGYISLLFKERIKLRRLAWVPFVVALAVLVDIYLKYGAFIASHGSSMLWADMITKQSIHFARLEWVFLFAGVWYACLQYLPECSGRRLRLLFHLPIPHRRSLYSICLLGLILCATLFTATFAGFGIILWSYGFPAQLALPLLKTPLPWALGGLVAYCATAASIAEPSLFRKLAYVLVGYAFISMLASADGYNGMGNSLWLYLAVCLPWPLAIEAAALRVKEGK